MGSGGGSGEGGGGRGRGRRYVEVGGGARVAGGDLGFTGWVTGDRFVWVVGV